jgi:hypothetical protein
LSHPLSLPPPPPSPSRSRTHRRLVDRYRKRQHQRQKVGRWLASPLLAALAHACRPSHLASCMSLAHTHAHLRLAGTPPRTDTCARAPSRAHTHTRTLCLWACSRHKGQKHEQAARRKYYHFRWGQARCRCCVGGVCAIQRGCRTAWLAG